MLHQKGGGAEAMVQITDMIQTIVSEMGRGNFSFLILVVGILQLMAMLRNSRGIDRDIRRSGRDVSRRSGRDTGRKANERISPKPGEKGEADEIQQGQQASRVHDDAEHLLQADQKVYAKGRAVALDRGE